MSERYYQQKSVSNRSLIADAPESVAQNDSERAKLKQYKEKIALLSAEEAKLSEIRTKLEELSAVSNAKDNEEIKNLRFEKNRSVNRINSYDRFLIDLEKTTELHNILTLEKERLRNEKIRERQAALEFYRQAALERQKFLQSCQTAPKACRSCDENSAKHAEEKYKGTRICAFVLSLLLSIVLLIGLMAQFTTTEEVTTYEKQTKIETIATYRCYVTATGVCYHSRTCQYIRNDDVESYVSTVYEAEQEGLRPCSKCRIGASQKTEIEVNKFVSVPKTEKHTKTNYFAAIIISVIFAVLLYNLIVFKSRREYKNSSQRGLQ